MSVYIIQLLGIIGLDQIYLHYPLDNDITYISHYSVCSVNTHDEPTDSSRLACDASAYEVGAVLSHRFPDGSEKPVAFMSRKPKRTIRKSREGVGVLLV